MVVHMHDEKWGEIVAGAKVPHMVEDFLAHFGDRYGTARVDDEDLRLTAYEAFAQITDVLVGAMQLEDMQAHSQALGQRRALQGVELAWLIDAIQLDFTVLWSHLRTAAGSEQDVLIDHVAQLHSVVTSYNLMVRDAFLAEIARSQHNAQLANARHMERLFAADDLDKLGLTEIARALGVNVDGHFDLLAAHPSAAVRLSSLLHEPIAAGKAFGHGVRGMFVAFWPVDNNTTDLPTFVDDTAALVPGVRFRFISRLAGVRAAARQAPRIFTSTGTPPLLCDAPNLLWAVAGDAIADFENSHINTLTYAVNSLRTESEQVYDTLVSYLDTGSVKATAEELCCHRNTVINRLRQVARTTGVDPTRPKDATAILLALHRSAQ